MTETYTGGTVKISCPSNYAENRRGSEVTLSFALPEGTTCEQADEATRRVRLLALKHVLAGQSEAVSETPPAPTAGVSPPAGSGASASAGSSEGKTPDGLKPRAASSKPKPSEITIGEQQSANEAPPFVQAAAPTEPQPARPSFAQAEATVSLPTPATTGTEGVSGPFVAAESAGQAVSAQVSAPEPASTAASSSAAGDISDEELTALSIEQAKRINGILPQQGGNIVNQVIARYVQPPRGLKSIPVEQRAAYVAELQGWSPA